MYLLGEGEGFSLVHNEPDAVVDSLKQNGREVGDFVYYGGIRGPIKIWRATFPSGIQANPKYLELRYPDSALQEATLT